MKIKEIQPFPNQVCIKVDTEDNETESGIIIQTDKEIVTEIGTVVSVGWNFRNNVYVGDRIAFKSYSLAEVQFERDGESYAFIEGDLILAKLLTDDNS